MSATIASVIELLGSVKAPETFKLVVVAEVAVRVETVVPPKLVAPVIFKLVPVAEVKLSVVRVVPPRLVTPDTFKLVEVTLEIVVLARTVRPEIFKLVEVTLVVLMLAGEKLVAAKLVKKPLVLVTDVPVAVVKPKAPDRVPPVSNR